MSRLDPCFARLQAEGRKGLIPYITAGDPRPAITLPLLHALAAAGADVIELGVPFSDPMADGPVIQRASERALAHGIRLQDCLDLVAAFRQTNAQTPVVLMGYANPVEQYGKAQLAAACAAAGVDGILVVDYPPEESADFSESLRAHGLDPIFLLAPTSSDSRMQQVARQGSGYLYYVSLRGVTGSSALQASDVAERVAAIRQHTTMPIGVGFGISDATSARAISQHADAVVIGSALIKLMESARAEGLTDEQIVRQAFDFMAGIRAALDEPQTVSA